MTNLTDKLEATIETVDYVWHIKMLNEIILNWPKYWIPNMNILVSR